MVSLVVFLCRGFSFVFGVGDGEWVRGFQSVCRGKLEKKKKIYIYIFCRLKVAVFISWYM